MTDLKDRIALVTGASRGIGYFTALALARAGAHVVAVARTVGGLEELDDAIKAEGGAATLVPLDLADMEGIDRMGAAIHERWGRLDVMVANAGILGSLSPIGHVQPKVFEQVMTLNVTATWRLIRSTEPLLMQSDRPRALLLSSGVAHSCRPFWSAYAASKAAVEVLGRTWAGETRRTALKVVNVNPGATRTAMRAQAVPGEDPATLPHPSEVAAALLSLCGEELPDTGLLYDVRKARFLSYHAPD